MGTPLVLYLFWMTNSDLGTAFFLLLSLMAAWGWLQNLETNGRFLYLAGLFGGLALASKYTAAFGLVILSLFVGWTCWKKRRLSGLRGFSLYCALLILPLIPWWTRNYIYTGNPVYPYLVETLGPKTADAKLMRDWHDETSDGSPGLHPLLHVEKLWHDAIAGVSDPAYDYAGPIFLCFFPLIIGVLNIQWALLGTIYFCASILLGLSGTYITRLLISYYAPLSLVVALAIVSITGYARKTWALALLLSILIFNIYGLSTMSLLTSEKGLSVATGRVIPAEYLRKPRNLYPNPAYAAFRFINGLGLPPQDRILLIGDARTFYSPRWTLANTPHDIPIIFSWANEAMDSEQLYGKLKANRIEILYNLKESRRIDGEGPLSDRAMGFITAMLGRHFQRVFKDHWTTLYRRID